MAVPFVVPDSAVPFILLQRTSLQLCPRLLRALGVPYRPWLSRLDARLRRGAVVDGFVRSLERDFEQIRPALPAQAREVLDIGCGVAGIDVLLYRHYASEGAGPEIHLLDRSETSENIYYGIHPRAAFYNSLAAAAEMLAANGVPAGRIHPRTAGDDGSVGLADGRADVALSLLSWGHHYPVEAYREAVWAALRPGGVLILDVRRGTGGEEALRRRFELLEPLGGDAKSVRYSCRRP